MSFISAFALLFTGSVKVGKTIYFYATGQSNMLNVGGKLEVLPHLTAEDGVTARVIESLDTFLVAAVLMYFGYGIYALFCAQKDDPLLKMLPQAVVPESLGELKQTIGQAILVVLMVLFTRQVWVEMSTLRWEHLIIPAAMLLMGAALRFSGGGKQS